MKKELKNQLYKSVNTMYAVLIAASVILSGCSKNDDDRKQDIDETETEIETKTSTGEVHGYKYTLEEPREYGPDFTPGWYIRDEGEERYILLCNGMEYTGGYFIEVSGIDYDSDTDTVVITAKSTRDENICTDAYTYPFSRINFDKIPEKVFIQYDSGYEIQFGGYICDTNEWALDVEIDEDYSALITSGFVGRNYSTYIYKTEDGKYRYINVMYCGSSSDDPNLEVYVKGSGTVENLNTYGFSEMIEKFGSNGYVLIKGDENNQIPVEQFFEMVKNGEF